MATVTVTVSNVVLSSLLSPSASSEQTSAAPTTTARAEPQAGVLEGASPVAYQASNPIILFIIQAGDISFQGILFGPC